MSTESERTERIDTVIGALERLATGREFRREDLFDTPDRASWTHVILARLRSQGLVEMVGAHGQRCTWKGKDQNRLAALANDRTNVARLIWPGWTGVAYSPEVVEHPVTIEHQTAGGARQQEEEPTPPADGAISEVTLKLVAALVEHAKTVNTTLAILDEKVSRALAILEKLL